MQTGLQGQLLQAHRIVVIGKDVEQLHHALDDLDRILGFDDGGRRMRHGCDLNFR